MQGTATRTSSGTAATSGSATSRGGTDYAYQAYRILYLGFIVAPIVAGLDKFFNILTDWPQYLAPFLGDIFGAQAFMYFVGIVEVVAGIGVAMKPRIFAYVVSAWLVGIILNLLLIPGYYDIALRDLGLAMGALALGRLAMTYGR